MPQLSLRHQAPEKREGGCESGASRPRPPPLEPFSHARQAPIRDYLHEYELESGAISDIVLAVEEAMTNAVRHSGASDDLALALWFEGPI